MAPQARRRLDPLSCNTWPDAPLPQRSAISARRIPLVGVNLVGTSPRSADASSNRCDVIHERDEHDNIRHVRGGQDGGRQRRTIAVGDQVMLRAWFPAIRGVWTNLRATHFRWYLRRIDDGAGPIKLSSSMEPYEQDFEHLVEYPRTLPFSQAVPASHGSTTELCRQVCP